MDCSLELDSGEFVIKKKIKKRSSDNKQNKGVEQRWKIEKEGMN